MRTLTSTLLAAQKQDASIPYVKIEAVNRSGGAIRLDWSRLYTGSEEDYFSAVTVPGDGSLVRARLTGTADANKLYRQRVTSPGPGSDFSQWTYTSQYNAVAVAAAALGAEVSIFWIKNNREIRRIVSTDYGATWGSPELIDYTATTSVYGLAAAYKPGGDLAIFFADQATLYIKKRVSGAWQTKAAWDKTTGNLSGLACIYDGGWGPACHRPGHRRQLPALEPDIQRCRRLVGAERAGPGAIGRRLRVQAAFPRQDGCLPVQLHRKIHRHRGLQPALLFSRRGRLELYGWSLARAGAF